MNKTIANLKTRNNSTNSASGWYGDQMLRRIIPATAFGLAGVVIYSACFPLKQVLNIASTGLLLAGASFITGGFLGFIFGIPRTNALEEERVNEDGVRLPRNSYKPNTNLEQISDWLTKILVGVGLTQIPTIIVRFNSMVRFFAGYLGNNSAMVACIIIYFSVFGFMMGFLWSRLYMASAIQAAEREAELLLKVEQRIVKEVKNKVDEQSEADAKALTLVYRYLNGAELASQNELTEAIKKASADVKVTVFERAQAFERARWNDPKKPDSTAEEREEIKRVIPIFNALIEADAEKKFHANYAELGYAFKDQENPDYVKAEKLLSQAIEMRDKQGKSNRYRIYEFNRAFCRIMINKNNLGSFSKEEIETDIRKAMTKYKDIGTRVPLFREWMIANNVR